MFNNGMSNGVVPVLPFGGNMGYNNGMNGWGDGWWIIIILFALFGWGGNGWGNGMGNGNSTGYIDAAIQRGFDNQSVINKLNGLENGICSLGYDQLNQMNGINTNVLQSQNSLAALIQSCCCGIENAIMQAQFANQTATNALSTQMAQCCCDNKALFAQAEYNRATDTCTITNAITNAAQQIMQNDNCNFRQLYDQQVALQMDALRNQNAELRSQLERCDDQNMLNAQTQYLTNYLRPQANPAFIVPAPWYSGGFYGYNNGGCCNGNGFGF